VKPAVYCIILLLIAPLQGSLLAPLARFGIWPDLGMAILYAIGLLTGPVEGALAGMGLGLMQDVAAASLVGLSGLSRGIAGFVAGFLGQRVLDLGSPSNIVVLAAFSLAESLMIAVFFETAYGTMPFGALFIRRMLPRAIMTALTGYLVLRLATRRDVRRMVLRRSLQKEL
jgi:rod shape-determining protein MreD